MANEQISLPSVILIVVLSGLVIRYLFFSPSRPAQQSSRDVASAQRTREIAVAHLQQMFPQVDRRALLWDLQRTGGSISATTDRILAGRIETPPITFQPPPAPASPTPSSSSQTQTNKAPPKPAEPDLITRYNLQNKVVSAHSESANKPKGWSSNREERQSLLQKRRDEMILAARRKMEAKIASEQVSGGT